MSEQATPSIFIDNNGDTWRHVENDLYEWENVRMRHAALEATCGPLREPEAGDVILFHPGKPLSASDDPVEHPAHYTAHPSGVECIQITEHMSFTLGNAIKYLWRADLKGDAIEDLRKAAWYIEREIAKREKEASEC